MKYDITTFIPHGSGYRITSRELEDLLQIPGAKVRSEINRLRCEGNPIASDDRGYFIADTPAEIVATIHNLSSRATAINRARDGLIDAQCKMIFAEVQNEQQG